MCNLRRIFTLFTITYISQIFAFFLNEPNNLFSQIFLYTVKNKDYLLSSMVPRITFNIHGTFTFHTYY